MKKYYLFKMNSFILNILSLIILAILVFILWLIKGNSLLVAFDGSIKMTILFMIPYFVLHEILHSLAYVLNGADFKNITYGIHLEKGVLCCLCKQKIKKSNILISLLYPFTIIGLITLVAGFCLNNYTLIFLSIMNIAGCSGDLIMFYNLSRLKDYEFSEYDDPLAFAIYTKEDLSKKKLIGLDYVGKKEKLEIKDKRKISISKVSGAFIISYLVLAIANVIW